MYRPEGSDKANNAAFWRKNVPGRGNSTCKGPEAQVFLVFKEEASVTREG